MGAVEMGWAGRCLEVGCMCVDICICKRAVYKGACLFLGFAIYVLAGGVGGGTHQLVRMDAGGRG